MVFFLIFHFSSMEILTKKIHGKVMMTSCESAPGIYYLLFTFSVSVVILKIKDWLTFPQTVIGILFVIVLYKSFGNFQSN